MAYTTIKKPSDYFNTNLYTANGSGKTISGMDFQPDFVWTKNRDNASYIPALVDAVRGGTKKLFSNNTDAEATDANAITAFNSDGYTFGSSGSFNFGTEEYVNWCWKANGAGSANTDCSISSTVSANTTSGFSIVSFTGTGANATVGHGLGVSPKWIIVKSRGVENWRVYSSYLGATKAMRLNGTDAADTDSSYWNGEPTSSVFTVGTNAGTNGSSVNMIAYCFAEKQGFSKFGSYTGNGSTDGTFVYTGFKPAFVMRKYATGGTAAGEGWEMLDGTRSSFNVADKRLRADNSNAEGTGANYYVDFISNVIKCRTADNATNNSGASYIYMAFAEQPLVGDNPATAR
jgi:hypothetical protein